MTAASDSFKTMRRELAKREVVAGRSISILRHTVSRLPKRIAMVRMMRRYVSAPPLGEMIGEELVPGTKVHTDEQILDAFRRLSGSGLHAVGTCRVGSSNDSVVDPRLKVIGVGGLRIADCSVMPLPVTGNTNAPAMALGLRAAGIILADRPTC